ncbi:MAG TPA: type II secretion system F family protein [Candidatus Limnocylindrales bacterium]|nr:type II secretion system F family protein [Candidatus Limnocylindrales bacterium]
MADFLCKVADASGRVYSQVEAAQTLAEARQKLVDRGLFVYSVRPQGGFVGAMLQRKRKRAVGGTDFLVFNQQFNTLIRAGLPILKSLDLLSERVAAPRLRPLLAEVRQRVREGALLSEALEAQGSFPKIYTTSVLAGEKSGNLSGVLDYYISYQRVTTGLQKKLMTALIYPAILVFAAVSIVTYIVTYVIPQFARLYADMDIKLPLVTRILVTITVNYRPFILLGVGLLAAAIIGIYFWSRTEAGGLALDRIKLKLPVLGETWIKFQVAQFVRTLATLLTGGTPLVQALETSADSITSRLVGDAVHYATKQVREGQSLNAGMQATGIMPELALEMIEVGEASGSLPAMLTSVAEFYEEEVNLRLTTLIAFVEPAILIFMAGMVLFILLALYLPIFSFSLGTNPGA